MSSVLTRPIVFYSTFIRCTTRCCNHPVPTQLGINHKKYTRLKENDTKPYSSISSRSLNKHVENLLNSNRKIRALTQPRYMSSNHEHDLPILSELPRRVFPNFMHYLRSLFFIHGLIVPYFDNEFTKDNFMDGAAKAVEVVSSAMSEGDFTALEPLLETKCLDDIKRKLSFTTAEQREQLKVKAENMFGQFIYEIGIMFDETEAGTLFNYLIWTAYLKLLLMVIILSNYQDYFYKIFLDVKKQRRWVEITFVAHSHPKFDDTYDDAVGVLQSAANYRGSVVKESVKQIKETVESGGGPVVLNYRFLREFSKGVDPSTTHWSISSINHFRMNE